MLRSSSPPRCASNWHAIGRLGRPRGRNGQAVCSRKLSGRSATTSASPRHLLSSGAELVLWYRRLSTTVAELNVEELPGRHVDLDAAVVDGSCWYSNHCGKAGDRWWLEPRLRGRFCCQRSIPTVVTAPTPRAMGRSRARLIVHVGTLPRNSATYEDLCSGGTPSNPNSVRCCRGQQRARVHPVQPHLPRPLRQRRGWLGRRRPLHRRRAPRRQHGGHQHQHGAHRATLTHHRPPNAGTAGAPSAPAVRLRRQLVCARVRHPFNGHSGRGNRCRSSASVLVRANGHCPVKRWRYQ